MKVAAAAAALLATAVVGVAAVDHHHAHQHLHKRNSPSPVDDVVVVPGPTILAYVLDGEPISAQEVQQGIANGTLRLAKDGALKQLSSSSSATTVSLTSSAKPSTTTTSSSSTTSSTSSSSSSSHSKSIASSPSPSANGKVTVNPSAPFSGAGTGIDTPFPSGQIDCSTFPSDYGAVSVPWLGLGGWTGVQNPGEDLANGYADIMTVVPSQCGGNGCCTEGSFCSYACPPGYQKAQWPTQQGATGQSVGGVQCKNGKLQLTNPSFAQTLCITGASEVTVLVENKLSEQVAVCRTDYPGTESETVPLDVQAGATSKLTCPSADNYYNWEGAHTSAQYYVNPAGVSVQQGCQWGSPGNPWGNYAPLNLGVGYSNGAAWLSIFQNSPTTNAHLEYTVTITGDNLSGTCRYSNGQYCGGANYDQCSSTTGCTVSLSSGTATFVFSD